MGYRQFAGATLSTLSILALHACGELPGFQVGQKSDYGIQSAAPIEFKDLDLLSVVDNSGSMAQEQDNLADSFEAFITQFAERDLNFHIGVTSTDVTANSVSGWWSPTNLSGPYKNIYNGGFGTLLSKDAAYKFLTPETPDYIAKFKDNVKLGTDGAGAEAGVLSVIEFTKASRTQVGGYNEGFIRPNGYLAIIFVSDEDEGRSPSDNRYIKRYPTERVARVDAFKASLASVKPDKPDALRVDAIVARSVAECPTLHNNSDDPSLNSVGAVYMELANHFGGQSSNVCEDFSSQLAGIGTQILAILTRFPLLQPPVNADVEVRVNGVKVAQGEVNGWVLVNEGDKYFVEFRGTGVPNNGDQIQITYVPTRPVG